jgi:CSLREA domain-containing protein
MSSARQCLSTLVTVGACALASAGGAGAATITVNSGGDALANDGQCTLREAVLSSTNLTATGGCAPAASGDDTIVLAVEHVTLSQSGFFDDNGTSGDLDVHRTLTIQGAPGGTTIDGAHLDRVFDVLAGGSLTLQDVTVTGGLSPTGNAGFGTTTNGGGQILGDPGDPGGDGGGVRSAGALTLRRVTVTQNATGAGGTGGAASAGDNNEAFGGNGGRGGNGGGIAAVGGTLTIAGAIIAQNATGSGGGGGNGQGGMDTDNTFNSGFADGGDGGNGGAGGGIYVGGSATATIDDATIAQNATGHSGVAAAGHGGAGKSVTTGGYLGESGEGGSGGDGGAGGGLAAQGTAVVRTSLIRDNGTGAGGTGGTGFGGGGGNGEIAGSGDGNGGAGGAGRGGTGGDGGFGGGLYAIPSANSDPGPGVLTVTASTVTGNTTGAGGAGGNGVGAPGGQAATGTGGAGGDAAKGSGGNGGSGGAAEQYAYASYLTAHVTLLGVTLVGNLVNSSAPPTGTATPGSGGNGSTVGADGSVVPGNPGHGGRQTAASGGTLAGSVIVNGSCENIENASATSGNVTYPGNSGCGGKVGDPKLSAALGDHGGPTPTFALGAGSAAIDAAGAPGSIGCTATDQRGVARPAGAACDAGAYELAAPAVALGDPTAVTGSGAILNATVNPEAQATTARFVWGTTAAYGSAPVDVAVPAGLAGVPVSAAVTGLEPGKTYHYAVVATNPDGTTTSADRTFTTPAPAGGGAGTGGGGGTVTAVKAPVLGALKLTPAALRAGHGTTITYTDTLAATTTFAVQRRARGIVAKGKAKRCVAIPHKRRKGARSCARWIAVPGTFTHADKPGKNTVKWNGKLKGKALKTGSYRLVATATTKAGLRGTAKTTAFTVKR